MTPFFNNQTRYPVALFLSLCKVSETFNWKTLKQSAGAPKNHRDNVAAKRTHARHRPVTSRS